MSTSVAILVGCSLVDAADMLVGGGTRLAVSRFDASASLKRILFVKQKLYSAISVPPAVLLCC
jgi:hypothetical protein